MSNLKAQFMEAEWCIEEAKARQNVGTPNCTILDGGIITVSRHSHCITTPSMPSPCTRTNQKSNSMSAQFKSEGLIYRGRMMP